MTETARRTYMTLWNIRMVNCATTKTLSRSSWNDDRKNKHHGPRTLMLTWRVLNPWRLLLGKVSIISLIGMKPTAGPIRVELLANGPRKVEIHYLMIRSWVRATQLNAYKGIPLEVVLFRGQWYQSEHFRKRKCTDNLPRIKEGSSEGLSTSFMVGNVMERIRDAEHASGNWSYGLKTIAQERLRTRREHRMEMELNILRWDWY